MDHGIENTMVNGNGFEFAQGITLDNEKPCDYRGRRIYKGEEYYIFDENGHEIYVHIEEVRDYLQDERLENIECYEILIHLIDALYDSYPIIM